MSEMPMRYLQRTDGFDPEYRGLEEFVQERTHHRICRGDTGLKARLFARASDHLPVMMYWWCMPAE
ncbi:hypothetical protein RvY_02115 [Ramazzottius varieornatus]|uniref:Uncharacterized protein n=1 Tax=Ramazzottius varieornatus TaxID=947166 RepID=A0A1D1UM05_RAMVA|nr:hypothetical protein RvY_02115 [Ramazzottius varieornatus]